MRLFVLAFALGVWLLQRQPALTEIKWLIGLALASTAMLALPTAKRPRRVLQLAALFLLRL